MLRNLIAFSLKRRKTILVVYAVLVAAGIYRALDLPVDVLPDIQKPVLTLHTECGSLPLSQMEDRVTVPLEKAAGKLKGVESIRSLTKQGMVQITVGARWKEVVDSLRHRLDRLLENVPLPEVCRTTLDPAISVMGEVLFIGLTGGFPGAMRAYADTVLRPLLEDVEGVSHVMVMGGEKQEYQVELYAEKMLLKAVSLDSVLAGIEMAVSPGSVSADVGSDVQEPPERNQKTFAALKNLYWINPAGDTLRLRDRVTRRPRPPKLMRRQDRHIVTGRPLFRNVSPGRGGVREQEIANVELVSSTKVGDAGVMGKPGVLLGIKKEPHANTLAITADVRTALEKAKTEKVKPGLPAGVRMHTDLFEQAAFIRSGIDNLTRALLESGILVVVVLLFFLLNGRTTLITLTAIPVSLLLTLTVFQFFGLSVNTLTLGGFAVAVGELVDDAVVDVENVFRRLRENARSDQTKPWLQVVYGASCEIRGSIVYATLVIVLAFIPLFALSGLEGKLFTPLGLAYVFSIGASLLVSLTLTPVLCSLLLPSAAARHRRVSPLAKGIQILTGRLILPRLMKHPAKTLVLAAGVTLCGLGSFFFLGGEFLPPFNEGSFTISTQLPVGVTLKESNRLGLQLEKEILALPDVRSVTRRTGRAEGDEHAEGIHSSELDVVLHPERRAGEAIKRDLREILLGYPGMSFNISQPISHRIDHMLSGVQSQAALRIYGPDAQVLEEQARVVAHYLDGLPEAVDVMVESPSGRMVDGWRVDTLELKRLGLKPEQMKRLEQVAEGGIQLGNLAVPGEQGGLPRTAPGQKMWDAWWRDTPGQKNIPVVVKWGDATVSEAPPANVPLANDSGLLVPAGQILREEQYWKPVHVLRENGEQRKVIQFNLATRDMTEAFQNIRDGVREAVSLPEGYRLEWDGRFRQQKKAQRRMLVLGALSLALMLIVLFYHLRSWNLVGQVMLGIPFSFVGAAAGIWMTTQTYSLGSLVGLFALAGIAARNGILLINHAKYLVKEEGLPWGPGLIVRSAQERIIPVLMTALTAIFALLPQVLTPDKPGKEILYSVAVVIFFGLITSLLFDLCLRPLILWLFGKGPLKRHTAGSQTDSRLSRIPG